MTATHTCRRALLKGAAVLTAIPVAVSAGGVPLFDVVEDLFPVAAPIPAGPDLSTFDGRLLAAADWLSLPPPPIVYDEEDLQGGVMLTPELMAWFRENDLRAHLGWFFDGGPAGTTADEQRTRLMQDREMLALFNGMDETEQGIMLQAIERFADPSIPAEVIQAESLAKLDAHRAAKRARAQ
ncbi:hypothetical protein Rumeso_04580 [Rubellimicrobium mesophilum DSM 19309]|uniref:Gluconate 2-dehydrogenase subunit 3 family protein n=1 Tax=Rubellimicrobium mesophilum DSM 19309 TaxID=442562 RepID=A0A017HHP5_9RHOB|nr:hypothetical protein [Rubellimicrobium mesophilum]EYD73845.1 hypothetical protein Rumeso_04580 [Rubellimicrobium mesophilum DSM 19309]